MMIDDDDDDDDDDDGTHTLTSISGSSSVHDIEPSLKTLHRYVSLHAASHGIGLLYVHRIHIGLVLCTCIVSL